MSDPLSLSAVAWTTDRDLRFTFCAGNAPASHGLRPGDFLGKTLAEVVPSEIGDSVPVAAHRRALEGEAVTYDAEWQGRTYRTRVEPLRDAEGRISGVSGIAVDVSGERRADEAVGASERRYRLLFEGSPLPMWVFDAKTLAFKAVNDAAVRHYGYSREEFLSMTLRDVRLPEDVPTLERAVAIVRDRGTASELGYVGRWRHRKKDGSLIHVDVYSTLISIEGGEGFLAVLQDVTKRLRAEETERETAERFRLAFEGSPIGMSLTSTEGRFLKVNRALCEMLSYSEDELIGRSFQEITHPGDRAVGGEALRRCLSGESATAQFEKRYIHKSGRDVWIQLFTSLQRDPKGRPLYFVSQMQDVTQRREAEAEVRRAREELERRVEERTAELRASEERWRSLVENAPDIILTVDRAGTILSINHTVTGLAREQVVGTSAYDWVPKERQAPMRAAISQVFREGVPDSYEVLGAGAGGSLRWYSTRVGPIRRGGEVVGATLLITDITDRKRIEEELRFRKTLLECQGEASIDGVLVVSPEGRMISFNRRFVEMWGIPEEIVRDRFDDAALQYAVGLLQDPDGFLARVRYLYGHPEERSRDEILFKDGRVFERHSAPVRDRDGTHHGRVWFFRDITEQKRAEERLRRLAEEQGMLLAHTTDFVYRHDTRGVFNYMSPAVEAVTGHPVRDWLAHYTTFLTDNPVNRKVVEYTERTLKTGEQSPPYLVEVRHRDGRPILLEVNERAYYEGGAVAGIVGVARDVTERERALVALRESERKYADLVREAPDPIVLLDPQGQVLSFNPAAEALSGRSASEVVGRDFREVGPMTREERLRASAEFERIVKGTPGRPFEVEILRPDGSRRVAEANPRLVVREGEPAGVQVTFRDVTERKRAEEQIRQAADSTQRAYEALKRTQDRLIQAEKLASVGMVMAGVAHEINNPLNVIYGNLHLLHEICRSEPDPDRRKVGRMLSDAMKAAGNARTVVEEFRHFARDPSAAEQADLRECIQEAVEQARPLCGKRVKIVKRLGAVPPIRLFRGQIRRAVQNLLKNAVEAIEGRGTVTVTVARRGRSAVVEVEDTGRGIPKENLSRMFQPFFTTKEPGRGFGLGLAMCAAVAQKHGGRISVKSRPGRGTRFTLRLPLKK